MVGPTAQLVALACHFNAAARGLSFGHFFPSNSTARFCESIRFGDAPTPDEWLAREAQPGRRALVAHQCFEDPGACRTSAGMIGGGGRWQLQIASAGRTDVWESHWQVGNRDAPERRIWRVSYAPAGNPIPPALDPPDAVLSNLQKTLAEALAFCTTHCLGGFAVRFSTAAECLASADPFSLVFHRDLAPAGLLSLPSQQLLAACQAAWVFGGMGSWNDQGFEGATQLRYEALSNELFALLNRAICAAINQPVR